MYSGQAWPQVNEVSMCGEPQLFQRELWATDWSGTQRSVEENEMQSKQLIVPTYQFPHRGTGRKEERKKAH